MSFQSSLSRRRFLAQAAIVTAAPFILPSWSAQTQPGSRLTLGFIGLGVQGRGLMNGFLQREGAQVVAVCDVDANRREEGRQRVDTHYGKRPAGGAFKGCLVFEDFRELLARPDIDAVVIATPDHWHALMTIAAAAAGKDIYCEKPLSKSVHESRAMVRAVRKHQRVLQVGSMQRSMREFRVACELVRNGLLGKIDRVEVTVGGPAVPCDLPEESPEPGLNWDLWQGPAPQRSYNSVLSPRGVHNHFPNWRHYREYGGGGVCDFGAHHFDIAQWGLGMDDSGPGEIIPPAGWQTALNGVRMRYDNGIELIHAPGKNDITFFGSEGVVLVDRGRIAVTIGGRTIEKGDLPLREQLDRVEQEFLQHAKVKLYNSTDHQGDWLAAMRSRKQPICDVRNRHPHRHRLPPGESRLLSRTADEMESRPRKIYRRHRRSHLAGCFAPRPVETGVSSVRPREPASQPCSPHTSIEVYPVGSPPVNIRESSNVHSPASDEGGWPKVKANSYGEPGQGCSCSGSGADNTDERTAKLLP